MLYREAAIEILTSTVNWGQPLDAWTSLTPLSWLRSLGGQEARLYDSR